MTGKSNNSKQTGQRVFARAVESRRVDSGTKSSACLTKMSTRPGERKASSTNRARKTDVPVQKEEIRSVPITLHKKSNSDQRPKCEPLTTETTRIDIGSTYMIRGVGKDFLSRTPSAQELRPTTETWDFRKLNFCTVKGTRNRVERKPTE